MTRLRATIVRVNIALWAEDAEADENEPDAEQRVVETGIEVSDELYVQIADEFYEQDRIRVLARAVQNNDGTNQGDSPTELEVAISHRDSVLARAVAQIGVREHARLER